VSRLRALPVALALAVAALACVLILGVVGTSTGATGADAAVQGSSLHAWGENDVGQLGEGVPVTEANKQSPTPVAVSGISCAVSAAVNDLDSFAVLDNGTIDAWGADEANKSGELGDEGMRDPHSTEPVSVAGITTATGLAVDTADVYVLLSNGTIVGWGDNRYGQFGNGEAESAIGGSNTPVAIAKSVNGVKALASSDDGAVLALLNNGEIDSWGNADENDTLGREGSHFLPGRVDIKAATPLTGATAVGEGANYSVALVGGEVKTWGDAEGPSNAVLGAGSKAVPGEVPVTVEDTAGNGDPLTEVARIATGANFTLALLKNGTVVAWGSGALGQLGNGGTAEEDHPVAVAGLTNIVAIAATEDTGYALDSKGHIWAWGNNTQGELGTGAVKTTSDEPVEITDLGSENAGLASGMDAAHELALGPVTSNCGGEGKEEHPNEEQPPGGQKEPSKEQSPPSTGNVSTAAGAGSSSGNSSSSGGTNNQPPSPPTSAELETKLATAFGLPSAKLCYSKRSFKIHIQQPPGYPRVVSAEVFLGTKRERSLNKKGLTDEVVLKQLPYGTFTIRIVARTVKGTLLTGTRTYHTCRPKAIHPHGHPRL
jgi:alpha-tubulin suppressor-like RCC1 family protein